MGRLTEQDECGNWMLKGVAWKELYEGQVITSKLRSYLYGALCKLKDYENTGLDPIQIERMDQMYLEKCKEVNCSEKENRWIPVTERLPENEDIVLVTVSGLYNHLTFCNAIQLGSYWSDGEWFIEGYPEWNNPSVVAWMPLPEPYREDDE